MGNIIEKILSPPLPETVAFLRSSDQIILQTIASYKLPFLQTPYRVKEPSSYLSNHEEQICSREISRLLARGAIEIVAECIGQFLSPFFVIRKSSGGRRFILNLKHLNQFVSTRHFKLEDWKTVPSHFP